jgi:membrane fusion protein, multidrug efflux system
VFVVGEDRKVDMRPVDVVYEDARIAVLGSGVKSGDRVVIDGQLRLSPGTPVSIVGERREETPVSAAPAERNGKTLTSPQAANPPATAQRATGASPRGG